MAPGWKSSPSQAYRDPRLSKDPPASSSAFGPSRLSSARPSPDVFQNGAHSRTIPQQHQPQQQNAFSIDSDDLLTPQSSIASFSSSSPQDSVPDPSGSSASSSSSPPHQSSSSTYGHHQQSNPLDFSRRQSVASPTFSSDSHRSSPNGHAHSLPLADELGRTTSASDPNTIRPGDRQAQTNPGLSPLSPFVEPFSPPAASEGRSPQTSMLFAAGPAPPTSELAERRSVSSLSSAHSQATAGSLDLFASNYADFRPPSTSSSVITPAASAQQLRAFDPSLTHPEAGLPGAANHFGGLGHHAPGMAAVPSGGPLSDRYGPTSRSSQDSSNTATTSSSQMPGAAGQPVGPEEISTIFVVGFPDDMHEREFQNMFIFSPGFEAAILKTPHGASGAGSNASNSSRDGVLAGGPKLPVAGGLNYGDQYGVPVMPGHNAFDPTLDDAPGGPTLSHALSQRDGPRDLNQRKQIIGFAKFRSRQEAIDAKDVLSGRRVDAEKDCVLKAEMAKKNLHTRRGLANEAPAGATSSVGVGNTAGNSSLPSSVLALGQQNLAIAASLRPDILADIAQRSPHVQTAAAAAHAANVDQTPTASFRDIDQSPPTATRDRTLSNPASRSAFDAFHSVPPAQVSPSFGRAPELGGAPLESRFHFGVDRAREGSPSQATTAPRLGQTGPAPYSRFGDAGYNKSLLQQLDSGADQFGPMSQNNSEAFAKQAFYNGREDLSAHHQRQQMSSRGLSPPPGGHFAAGSPPAGSGNGFGGRFQALTLKTGLSNAAGRATSPPSAGMLSPRGGNPADMNPPINTLYVGGLPAVLPSLTGPMSASHLEDSLRAVFSRSPGFKRLCFRQKSK